MFEVEGVARVDGREEGGEGEGRVGVVSKAGGIDNGETETDSGFLDVCDEMGKESQGWNGRRGRGTRSYRQKWTRFQQSWSVRYRVRVLPWMGIGWY